MPVVRVPVLSKQIVSTRANVSIQYNSWTNTFLLANLIDDIANTVLVNKTKPSGIVPINAATVDKIASLKDKVSLFNLILF